MFKHKDKKAENKKEKPEETKSEISDLSVAKSEDLKLPDKINISDKKEVEGIKELLEKNLKWSQIIYEQNRKINNKLFWTAFAGWLRLLFIIVPLIFAILFLPPMLKGVFQSYGSLFGSSGEGLSNNSSLEQILKVLPLNPEQQDKVKTMLK